MEIGGTINLPASKSECNRALMISALSQGTVEVENISDAGDSQVMKRLLESDEEILDVGDAGTAMRFLAAYYSFRQRDVILTGSKRMSERPIGPLVDALRHLGADIHYPGKEGFPPLAIYGRNAHFGESRIAVPGNISSQYISALLMIAPTLPGGLEIEITGDLFSAPYVEMTLLMLSRCGIVFEKKGGSISVPRQNFSFTQLKISNDWSAASYFYFVLAQAGRGGLILPGLEEFSSQGDRRIAEWMKEFGIQTSFGPEGAVLNLETPVVPQFVKLDFKDCPDLAQGMIVFLASRNIKAEFTGFESLRIKETDRIAALDAELRKFNCRLVENPAGKWKLEGTFSIPREGLKINTWGDHRMAMAFSQLKILFPDLEIENPEVVKKSFPGYWDELKKIV